MQKQVCEEVSFTEGRIYVNQKAIDGLQAIAMKTMGILNLAVVTAHREHLGSFVCHPHRKEQKRVAKK